MKLHWSPRSPYVRKVMIVAHEVGVQDRLTLVRNPVAMTKLHPAVMAVNPLNKIPTLELDNGSVLFDSAVISRYFADLAGDRRLYPAGEAQWGALRGEALGAGLTDLLIFWRNERERATPSQPHLDAYAAKVDAVLAMLEREAGDLAARPYSIGHVAIACALGYADFRFDTLGWRNGRPSLTNWFDADFSQRPSSQKTVHVQD